MPKRLLIAPVALLAMTVALVVAGRGRRAEPGPGRAELSRPRGEAPSADAVPAAAGLFGRVLEEGSDRPVTDATVLAYEFESARTLRATTAADGTFDLPDAPAAGRRFQIVVRAQGLGAASLYAIPGAPIVVRLPRPGGLRGKVAAGDAAAPGCRVSVHRTEFNDLRESLLRELLPGELVLDGTATTGEDGAFSVSGLAPGTYIVLVDRPGFVQCGTNHVVVSAGETAYSSDRIVATAELPVDVFDEETGEPLDGARFEIAPRGAPASAFVPLKTEPRGAGTYAVQAGFDGKEYPWIDLRVSRDGYAPRVLMLAAQQGSMHPLDLGDRFRVALGRGATIEGRLWSGDGPAEGGLVFVGRAWTSAGADGSFEIGGIDADEEIEVYADDGDGGPIAVANLTLRNGERRRLDIGGPDATVLEGRIAVGGAPAVSERVRLSGATEAYGRTDHDGAYRFEGLNPGRHRLSVDTREGYYVRHAEVAQGERRRLDIDARAAISGTIVDSESDVRVTRSSMRVRLRAGAPIGGYSIGVVARHGTLDDYSAAHADDDGRFLLHVEPGTYRLDCWSCPDLRAIDPPLVEAREGAPVQSVLRVAWEYFEGRIDLLVKDARTGQPVAAQYAARKQFGEIPNGRHSLSVIDPGLHRLWITSDAHVAAQIEVEIDIGRPTAERTILLEPAEAVRVTKIGRDSPGAQGGLRTGDTILSCDGVATTNVAGFRAALKRAPGSARLEIDRDGERRFATIPAEEPTLRVENAILGR